MAIGVMTVAVITLDAREVEPMRRALRAFTCFNLEVNTVEGFQGR